MGRHPAAAPGSANGHDPGLTRGPAGGGNAADSSGSSSGVWGGSDCSGGDGGGPCCWICLEGDGGADSGGGCGAGGIGGAFERPCACPRAVHPRCLGRWQLQQAGRPEERACRFCGGDYGDWRPRLSAKARGGAAGCGGSGGGGGTPDPLLCVSVGGWAVRLQLPAGPSGKALFKRQLAWMMGSAAPPPDADISFQVTVPRTGERITLDGFGAIAAAAHCAAAAAAAMGGAAAAPGGAQPPPPPPPLAFARGLFWMPFVEHTDDDCYPAPAWPPAPLHACPPAGWTAAAAPPGPVVPLWPTGPGAGGGGLL
ncbi:MAG: hypothetical protein J3K34DRAFT_487368 [Monoraphidium minutum]|nr:MAG: hypothetical protein J3K34DRAFT_487368 [Monoraphidium minutum]